MSAAASSFSATASPSVTSAAATGSMSPYRYELEIDPEIWFLEDDGYELAVFHSHRRPSRSRSRTRPGAVRPVGRANVPDLRREARRAARVADYARLGRGDRARLLVYFRMTKQVRYV